MLGASGASIWCFSPKLEIGSHANDSSNHIESSSNHPKIIQKSPASAAQSSDFRRLGDLGSASQRNHQLRQLLGQRPIDLSLLLLSCLHLQRQPQGDHYAKWWEMTTFKPHQTSSLIFLRFSPLSSAVLAAWPCGENTTLQQKTWWSLRMPPARNTESTSDFGQVAVAAGGLRASAPFTSWGSHWKSKLAVTTHPVVSWPNFTTLMMITYIYIW